MYAHAMQELNSSAWNDLNPFKCPCRNGWLLSDFDTWHRCHTHGHGVPHPESESDFDMAAHVLKICREAFVAFRDKAHRNGLKRNFNEACLDRMGLDRSPKAWVNAADEVAEECRSQAEDELAQALGFSCALEMRLADEASIERYEYEHGYC